MKSYLCGGFLAFLDHLQPSRQSTPLNSEKHKLVATTTCSTMNKIFELERKLHRFYDLDKQMLPKFEYTVKLQKRLAGIHIFYRLQMRGLLENH